MKIAGQEERAKALAKARKALNASSEALSDNESRELYLSFMARYAQMEVAYKSLLADYLKATGKQVDPKNLKVESRQVKRVLSYYSVDLSDADRDHIFSGRQKLKERQARGLRNSLAHSPNKAAIDELNEKQDSFTSAMQAFEDAITPSGKKRADEE